MKSDEIIEQLREISDTLADRAISLLRDAVNESDSQAQKMEKKVTQARRAVEKAIHLLSIDGSEDD